MDLVPYPTPNTPQTGWSGVFNRRNAQRAARLIQRTWRQYQAYRRTQIQNSNRAGLQAMRSQSSSRSWVDGLLSSSGRGVTGGMPIHHSTSGGRFPKGGRIVHTKTAEYNKHGFSYDATVGGRVQDPDCVYIGHTSWPVDRTLFCVMLSFVRAMLRHVDVDVETSYSVLPFLTGVDTISIEWNDSSNTPVTQDFPYSPGAGDTVTTLAQTLYTFFRNAIVTNAKRYYQRLIMKTGDTVRVMLNLSSAKVEVCNTSYLKVQNSTQSAESGGGGNDSEDIAAVPLQGFSYFGRGNFTGLKPYSIANKNTTIATDIPNELNSDATLGIITLRADNSTGWAASGLYYGNPPPAAEMKNVKSSAYVTLEPGVMKTDKLEDCHKLSFNQFLYKMYIAGYTQSVDTGANGQWSRSLMGHFKVFGLEKKLYSNNQDKVEVRYEINQFIRSRVYLRKQSHSLQENIGKLLVDFIPPP